MKKLIATTLTSALLSVGAFAQGTINFQNVGPGLNVPVNFSDGVTKASGGTYTIALLAGASANSLSQIATTTFSASAGYFLGGVQAIPTVAPGGTAFIEIEVWNTTAGATFAAAQTSGQGNAWAVSNGGTPFTVVTGGAGSPPSSPAVLTGLTAPFNLNAVPEPSTFALAGLGAAAMLIFRRRK